MGLSNPIPKNLSLEIKNASKILSCFLSNTTTAIPQSVLSNAKGLAILSVFKAGFIFSARVGSGIVIARLEGENKWSAPAAIATGGFGFGGQIGSELTDVVMILNTDAAVEAFYAGNVSLGSNLSIAIGPIGRNAEAAATLNKAAVFSYSVTRGLFAGISIEGSVLVERKDANCEYYGNKVSAQDILTGNAVAPIEAEHLYSLLTNQLENRIVFQKKTKMINTVAPMSTFISRADIDTVTAMFEYSAQHADELSFRSGDRIHVIEKSESDPWWKGSLDGNIGLFPSNYVQ